jgi:hypothetical protein
VEDILVRGLHVDLKKSKILLVLLRSIKGKRDGYFRVVSIDI